MIVSFRNKNLEALWETGRSRIDSRLHARILRRLDRLDNASVPEDMNLPGFDFHALRGFDPRRHAVQVNGPWCVTFAFEEDHAVTVDLEQYR